jgi:hypothetical protein
VINKTGFSPTKPYKRGMCGDYGHTKEGLVWVPCWHQTQEKPKSACNYETVWCARNRVILHYVRSLKNRTKPCCEIA